MTPPRIACFRMDYARKTAGAMCSSVGALHARGIFVPCTLRKESVAVYRRYPRKDRVRAGRRETCVRA